MARTHKEDKDLAAAEQVLRKHAGFARTRDFEAAGLTRRYISELLESGMIERIRHGLYRAFEFPVSDGLDLVQACVAVPDGIIFLGTAIEYYSLSTYVSPKISVAVDRKAKVVLPDIPPIELHYLSPLYHQLGVELVSLPSGQARIYSKDKTVCDCFRFRNQIGLDVSLEALRNYLGSPDSSIDRLVDMARQCRVELLMRRYMEAMM